MMLARIVGKPLSAEHHPPLGKLLQDTNLPTIPDWIRVRRLRYLRRLILKAPSPVKVALRQTHPAGEYPWITMIRFDLAKL